MSDQLTAEVQAIVDKVEKLLRLAAKNPNEAEAASATAKAMELLAAYNLDMGTVERNGGETGKRADELLNGGYYEWERDLWRAVARLNFCLYWSQITFSPMSGGKVEKYVRVEGERFSKLVQGVNQHQHRVVGRTVNIAATKAMAGYLQNAVQRLTRDRCREGRIPVRSPWANSFREGVTDRLTYRIYERRRHLIAEEEQKRRDAEEAAVAAGRSGVSTGTALTLSTYVDQEYDENVDFVFGKGTSAKWAAERAQRAAAEKAADEEYTRWAAANPEKARREEQKRKEKAAKQAERDRRKNTKFVKDLGAYYAGRDAAEAVSLDPQADTFKPAGLL